MLGVPHTLHHELQIRRLDPIRLAGHGRLREHGVDELRLDVDALLRGDDVVPPLDRPKDRCGCRRAVETIEPQVVREEVRDPPLEHVELRERVVAKREKQVRAQRRPEDDLWQLADERSRPLLLAVVDEVLLELVEDEVEVAVEDVRPVSTTSASESRRAARRRPA